jgi:hypothetical protein
MKFFLRLLTLLFFPALSLTAQVPELVDLGLSVKWSSMNLGAECPEGYGDYFMWGEITPANDRDCSWSTYKYANGAEDMLTKYVPKPDWSTIGILRRVGAYIPESQTYGDNGFNDNKIVLDPQDDAAHVALGGKFRMPTLKEWQELQKNCTWTWTQFNGVNGYICTSKVEGFTNKSIFLPAAGLRVDSVFLNQGLLGYYWSASLNEYNPSNSWGCEFKESDQGWLIGNRCFGLSIRPVSE